MSKAYYYCKNFSFKEVNNLFAYSTKDPSQLTGKQRINRLYKYKFILFITRYSITVYEV